MSRFFEDFAVGDVYCSTASHTVTEEEHRAHLELTGNTNPIHRGPSTLYDRPVVVSTLTLALVTGMSVVDTALANLGWDEVRLPRPVFAGDTLRAESEVVAVRESRLRPDAGIVTVRTRGVNQHGEVVIEFRRSFLVPRR